LKYFQKHQTENQLYDYMEKEFEVYLKEEADYIMKMKEKKDLAKGDDGDKVAGGKHERGDGLGKKIKPSQSGDKKNSEVVLDANKGDSIM